MAKSVLNEDELAKRRRWKEFAASHPKMRATVIKRTVLSTVELLKFNKRLAQGVSIEELSQKLAESLFKDFKSTWAINAPMTLEIALSDPVKLSVTIHLQSSTLGVDIVVEVPQDRY